MVKVCWVMPGRLLLRELNRTVPRYSIQMIRSFHFPLRTRKAALISGGGMMFALGPPSVQPYTVSLFIPPPLNNPNWESVVLGKTARACRVSDLCDRFDVYGAGWNRKFIFCAMSVLPSMPSEVSVINHYIAGVVLGQQASKRYGLKPPHRHSNRVVAATLRSAQGRIQSLTL